MARVAGSPSASALSLRSTVILVVAVLVAALSMTLLHPALTLPVAGTCLAALVFGGQGLLAVLASVGAGALATVVSGATTYVVGFPLVGVALTARAPYVLGALTIGSLLLLGPVTAGLVRRRPPFETTFVLAAALSVMQVLALASLASGAGQTLTQYVSAAFSSVTAQVASLADAQAAFVAAWPSMIVALNGLTAILTIAGTGVAATRLGVDTRRLPPLAVIDLDPRMVLLPIVAIALLAASRLPLEISSTLDVVGTNLLMVARWMFFLQGLAMFAGLYERANFGRAARSLGYVLLGITEALIPLVSLTGLADIWLNLRRLPRDGKPAQVVEAPSDTD
jgi:hypothetical protein